ncbi:MAG: molecular chaperone GroEL, partial [Proteobacteria bacterium]|nr:molecular chaperone GroEL [Pseudomonadota bacterium]
LSDLGRAQRAVLTKDTTTIIGGHGTPVQIETRRSEIRTQIEKTTSSYDKDKLQERLAKLAGGVGVIHVGALSEAELKNKKEAIEDAINATKAAIAEGIVPGGGLTLLRAAEGLALEEAACQGDERTGIQMLRRALESPTRQIAKNSGFDDGVVVASMRAGTGNYGFDAARGQYVDLVEAGIIDPTKVVRMALENAVSVAGVLLLSEGTVTEIPEPTHGKEPAALGIGE